MSINIRCSPIFLLLHFFSSTSISECTPTSLEESYQWSNSSYILLTPRDLIVHIILGFHEASDSTQSEVHEIDPQ